MRAEGKKTIINEKGKTADIINAVVEVFLESYRQTEDIAAQFSDRSIFSTCQQIVDFVCSNFNYKVDPAGEQWIRTPNRILTDREADCKSYSIFICSVLSNLGIRNAFRFASYSLLGNYTHVYSIAYDENGNEIVIDCVAIQQGKQPFEEVKYKREKTIMNDTTIISKLSGLNDVTIDFSVNDTVAMVYAKSMLMLSIVTQNNRLKAEAEALIWVLQNFKTNKELDSVGYVYCVYQMDRLASGDYKNFTQAFKSTAKSYATSEDNPQSPYKRDPERLQDPLYISLRNKWEENVIEGSSYYSNVNTEDVVKQLSELAFNTLYLFADVTKLTKTMKAKRENQKILVDTIINGSAVSYDAALNFLQAAFAVNYHTSAEVVLSLMFPKIFKDVTVSGINNDPDNIYHTTTTDAKKSDTVSTINKWINTAVDSFTKIWGAVTGSNQKLDPNKVITPQYTDGSGSTFAWILFAAALGGGFYYINKSKKGKKK